MQWTPPERTNRNYIRTISGKKFWPLNPRPEDVDINDIAHALSLMCRYNGHVPYLYSVAQHSLNVYFHSSNIWGLVHDATEAYLPDVPSPIKTELPCFKMIEANLAATIANALGLSLYGLQDIKLADTEVLQWEYAWFRPRTLTVDAMPKHVNRAPAHIVLSYLSPDTVRTRFLYEYERVSCGKL